MYIYNMWAVVKGFEVYSVHNTKKEAKQRLKMMQEGCSVVKLTNDK